MKIKFLKEYRAFLDFEGSFEASNIYKVGDTKNVATEAAQWLINNGFAKEVKESGWWKPKNDVDYYYISDDGAIVSREGFLSMSTTDDKRVDIGNAFRSKAAAERYRDYLKAIAAVRQDEGVLTPDELEDKTANSNLVYFVGHNQCGCLVVGLLGLLSDCAMSNGIFFGEREHAQSSLDNHPDEWKIIANYDWSRE